MSFKLVADLKSDSLTVAKDTLPITRIEGNLVASTLNPLDLTFTFGTQPIVLTFARIGKQVTMTWPEVDATVNTGGVVRWIQLDPSVQIPSSLLPAANLMKLAGFYTSPVLAVHSGIDNPFPEPGFSDVPFLGFAGPTIGSSPSVGTFFFGLSSLQAFPVGSFDNSVYLAAGSVTYLTD